MLESGYSARNFQDHQDAMQKLFGPFDKLAPVPELLEIAVDLQGRLFKAGIGRSVGVADLIVAAHALHYRGEGAAVTIVHYDADYDRLARVAPELRTQWLVPRGSL
jgi:predicted nucleic acid-binding protein